MLHQRTARHTRASSTCGFRFILLETHDGWRPGTAEEVLRLRRSLTRLARARWGIVRRHIKRNERTRDGHCPGKWSRCCRCYIRLQSAGALLFLSPVQFVYSSRPQRLEDVPHVMRREPHLSTTTGAQVPHTRGRNSKDWSFAQLPPGLGGGVAMVRHSRHRDMDSPFPARDSCNPLAFVWEAFLRERAFHKYASSPTFFRFTVLWPDTSVCQGAECSLHTTTAKHIIIIIIMQL